MPHLIPAPSRMRTSAATILLWLAIIASVSSSFSSFSVFASSTPPPMSSSLLDNSLYPTWAHYHFVWLDSARSNQSNILNYVAEYASYNISVGAIDIDSEWSTGNNNFIVDTSKFPSFQTGLLDSLHAQGIRVILWATSMVDTDSSNFAQANSSNYFIRNAVNETALMDWWHGTGGLLDYTNPEARKWWEGQLNNVLLPASPSTTTNSTGIDGWKCDGTDPYIIELLFPQSYAGPITYQQYADWYYGHFFNYSRTLNPEALIWSRPVDSEGNLPFNVSAFLAFSPKYVMFSGWVGDQDPDFSGLRAAAINILESAWQNYTNFASDTGGYRSGNRTRETLLRWSQLNAFLPLFENGGDDEHRPWAFDNPAVGDTTASDTYRRLVAAHYELVPYLLTTGVSSYANGVSAIHPSASPPSDFPFIIEPNQVSDWSYALGPSMFASPILFEGMTAMNVTLPSIGKMQELQSRWGNGSGSGTVESEEEATDAAGTGWYDYWNPTNTYQPGTIVTYNAPLVGVPASQMLNPVFVMQGSVLPLHVSTHFGLFKKGHEGWAAALTLLVQDLGSNNRSSSVRVYDSVGKYTSVLDVSVGVSSPSVKETEAATAEAAGDIVTMRAGVYTRPLILVLRNTAAHHHQRSIQSVYVTSLDKGHYLAREIPEPVISQEYTPLALAWDTTSPSGGKYPVGDTHRRVHSHFESKLAGTFSYYSRNGKGEEEEELIVYLSAEDTRHGVNLEIKYTHNEE